MTTVSTNVQSGSRRVAQALHLRLPGSRYGRNTRAGDTDSHHVALRRACAGLLRQISASFILLLMSWATLQAQTIDDGIMLPKKTLFAGALYTHDSWDNYWEGGLKRVNGNIGTITTQTTLFTGNYGVTDRLNIISTFPYVWTGASQGVLSGMKGFQDFTVAAKYEFLRTRFTSLGSLRAIGVVSGGTPLTDYTPDFQPLSIGLASKRVASRLTLNFLSDAGWFVNGSAAYTWRGDVGLDRPYYFTENRLFLTDQVDMPNVVDYSVFAGYMRKGRILQVTFNQQRTLGGGDIRRQDIPFVSNRMNFSRIGGMVMWPIPKLNSLAFQVAGSYVVDGRNVGQATTITTGLLYTFSFRRSRTR